MVLLSMTISHVNARCGATNNCDGQRISLTARGPDRCSECRKAWTYRRSWGGGCEYSWEGSCSNCLSPLTTDIRYVEEAGPMSSKKWTGHVPIRMQVCCGLCGDHIQHQTCCLDCYARSFMGMVSVIRANFGRTQWTPTVEDKYTVNIVGSFAYGMNCRRKDCVEAYQKKYPDGAPKTSLRELRDDKKIDQKMFESQLTDFCNQVLRRDPGVLKRLSRSPDCRLTNVTGYLEKDARYHDWQRKQPLKCPKCDDVKKSWYQFKCDVCDGDWTAWWKSTYGERIDDKTKKERRRLSPVLTLLAECAKGCSD